jgi:putative ABC transport system permease protein
LHSSRRSLGVFTLLLVGFKRSPARSLITLVSIALTFTLFGLLYSISASFDYTLDWLSADSMRVTSRVSLREPLPLSHLDEIERTPGVTGVEYAALFSGHFQDPKQTFSGAAIAPERVMLFPHMKLSAEAQSRMQRLRTAAIAGKVLAEKYGWKVGDRIAVNCPNLVNEQGSDSWSFDIVGIYDMEGNSDLANELYVNYEYVNEGRATGKNGVNIFIVRIARTASTANVGRDIDLQFRNSSAETLTRSDREWVGSAIRRIGNVHLMVNIVLGAALFTLFILTRNAIAQSVRDRTRDFGVMKVLGFSSGALSTLIVCEALIICLSGAMVGLAGSLLVSPWFARKIEMTVFVITPQVFVVGMLAGVFLALAASVAPAIGVALRQPVVALRKAE